MKCAGLFTPPPAVFHQCCCVKPGPPIRFLHSCWQAAKLSKNLKERWRWRRGRNAPTPHSNTAPLMSLWSGKVPPQLRSLLLQSCTLSAAKCTHTHTLKEKERAYVYECDDYCKHSAIRLSVNTHGALNSGVCSVKTEDL